MPNEAAESVGPEVTSESHEADMSNIDYSKAKHGRFYANHVGASTTMFDIRLILSDVDVDRTNNKLIANETVTLFLSPELAFMVHAALGAALFNYTRKFGKLRIPDNFVMPPSGPTDEAPEAPQSTVSPELVPPQPGS